MSTLLPATLAHITPEQIREQEQRERGLDFGQSSGGGQFLRGQVFSEAIRLLLGLTDLHDDKLPLADRYSGFKESLRQLILDSSKKSGRPAESQAVWKAFAIEELLHGTATGKNKKTWAEFAEILFSITLYEMLRCVLEAMGNLGGNPPESSSLDEDEEELVNDRGQMYHWPTLAKVVTRIWRAILTELAMIIEDSRRGDDPGQNSELARKIKLLQSIRLSKETRLERQEIIDNALTEHAIDARQGMAFANDLLSLLAGEDTIFASTPLFEIVVLQQGQKTVNHLAATPLLIDLTRAASARQSSRMVPQHAPLLIPPRPWDIANGSIYSGGYYCDKMPFYTFKGSNQFIKSFQATVAQLPNAEVFAAVNALQNTPWRINARVMQTIDDLMLIAELAAVSENPAEKKKEENKEEEKDDGTPRYWIRKNLLDVSRKKSSWRFKQPGWRFHGKNLKQKQGDEYHDNYLNHKLFADLQSRDRFYFAYHADTRGRLYAKAKWLSPYGDDLAKALLEFADPKPLTEAGVTPLAIHGSQQVRSDVISRDIGLTGTHYDLSLEQRYRWVEQQRDNFLATAQNPAVGRWWMDVAKKPFQFLAFCFAWADYLQHGAGVDCSLPVHQDGTCNGLQHIAAMTGDRALAEATNVLPDSLPHDIYLEVAQAALANLQGDTGDDARVARPTITKTGKSAEEIAEALKKAEGEARKKELSKQQARAFLKQYGGDIVDRELAKRVVMVIPYGATQLKKIIKVILRKQSRSVLAEKYKEYTGENPKVPDNDKKFTAEYLEFRDSVAECLEKYLKQAMKQRYPVIEEFTACLKQSIAPLLDKNLPVIWVTPSGFCAIQRGFVIQKTEIARSRFGLKHRIAYDVLLDEQDKRSQRQGILPNFIHSFDSAHLVKTINLASLRGVRNFSVVHDSYATHPADAAVLAECIRTAFVEVYSGTCSPLQHFVDWCATVRRVADLEPVERDGFSAVEKDLLALVNQWQAAGLCTQDSPARKPPEVPFLPEFDVTEVMHSTYFFS